MREKTMLAALLAGLLAVVPMTGCENLPGDPGTQGAVIGGVGGAAAGAAISENRLLGALIGGAVGAGGGYLIGANMDSIRGEEREEAIEAEQRAQENPATPDDVRDAETADLNDDGFVTMDEVVAMSDAGLSDQEILDRLEATDQIFELTEQQQEYLVDQGVSRRVVREMAYINQEQRQELLEEQQDDEVIGRDPEQAT